MFGYVNVYKNELKIKDFNVYRAYYCGLCKALGEKFGALSRLGLSYDFTFLAIFLDSLNDKKVNFSSEGCAKHIGKKHLVVKDNPSVDYAADMSVALNYFKILDDIKDDFFTKSYFLYLPYKCAMRKISDIDGDIINEIKLQLDTLSRLEKEKCAEPDIASDAFAKIMRAIFSVKNGLEDFGYNLGKFIYLIDALDDLEKDKNKKSYNPYIEKFDGDIAKTVNSAEFALTYTLSRLADEFEKQKIYKNKEILKNIIYLGLRAKLDTILKKYRCDKGENNEKSL